MSVKSQLTAAIAEMPDSLSLEEVVERLYRAFKLQQKEGTLAAVASPGSGLRTLVGLLGKPSRSLTLEEMDAALQDRFSAEENDRR